MIAVIKLHSTSLHKTFSNLVKVQFFFDSSETSHFATPPIPSKTSTISFCLILNAFIGDEIEVHPT